jgi:hypothetical protein
MLDDCDFAVTKCTFKKISTSGLAGTLTIPNGRKLVISQCTFDEVTQSDDGAAVFSDGAIEVQLKETTFSSCGKILSGVFSSVTIDDVTVQSQSVTAAGSRSPGISTARKRRHKSA